MFYVISFLIGSSVGAGLMKAAVDYRDRHLCRETAKTDHFRTQYEEARVTLAYYQGSANFLVATPNNAIPNIQTPPPIYPDIFTQSDIDAMNQGQRVVRMRRGVRLQNEVNVNG